MTLDTIRDYCDHYAKTTPKKAFLLYGNGWYSRSKAQTCIQGIARIIAEHGVAPKETVAFACGNSPESALCVLGIMYGGYVATAVNLVAGDTTIGYVLEHSEARLVFVDAASEGKIRALVSEAVTLVRLDQCVFYDTTEATPYISKDHDHALLMYTSGTTGRPKGVLHSHKSLLAGGQNVVIGHELTEDDRALCTLPLYHINGLCVTLIAPLVSGGSVTLPEKFSTSKFWPDIKDHECSWFSLVPTQISYLLHQEALFNKAEYPCLRFGRSASAPLSPDIHAAFEQRFEIPIIETMGLTETAAQILSNPLPPKARKIGSPGLAVGNEVIIADLNQDLVAANTEGEVLVRGDNVMQGYLKNPTATTEAMTPKGWLRTGDLGRMDADGYVFITGRIKELIIKGGENIAPREIDEALYSHRDVVEAAAFACPCKNYGERVEAAVALSPDTEATAETLRILCEEKLGKFKTPDRIHVMTELPKGPSGKIQRRILSETFGL